MFQKPRVACLLALLTLLFALNAAPAEARTTLHVNATTGSDSTGNGSLAQPYRTITAAINAPVSGAVTILIAPGVYVFTTQSQMNMEHQPLVLRTDMELVGADRNTTIIDGLYGSFYSGDTMISCDNAVDVAIRHLTIRDYARGLTNYDYMTAVHALRSRLTLDSVRFTNTFTPFRRLYAWGWTIGKGAVYFEASSLIRPDRQDLNVIHCTFERNRVSAIWVASELRANISHSTFNENHERGITFEQEVDGNITNCVFKENLNGGAYFEYRLNGNVRNCDFLRNEASQAAGMGVFARMTGFVENCRFRGNTTYANFAACGISVLQGAVRNCVFAGNSSNGNALGNVPLYGTGLCVGTLNGRIEKNEFFANSPNILWGFPGLVCAALQVGTRQRRPDVGLVANNLFVANTGDIIIDQNISVFHNTFAYSWSRLLPHKPHLQPYSILGRTWGAMNVFNNIFLGVDLVSTENTILAQNLYHDQLGVLFDNDDCTSYPEAVCEDPQVRFAPEMYEVSQEGASIIDGNVVLHLRYAHLQPGAVVGARLYYYSAYTMDGFAETVIANTADTVTVRQDPQRSGYYFRDVVVLFDYRLAPTSPAIDAGLDVPEVSDDFQGRPRFQNDYSDIGAWEAAASGPIRTPTPTPLPEWTPTSTPTRTPTRTVPPTRTPTPTRTVGPTMPPTPTPTFAPCRIVPSTSRCDRAPNGMSLVNYCWYWLPGGVGMDACHSVNTVYHWYEPLYDDTLWEMTYLPQWIYTTNGPNFYRTYIYVSEDTNVDIFISSNDSSTLYLNGNLVGNYGNYNQGCGYNGCLNKCHTPCLISEDSLLIPTRFRQGVNLIALLVSNVDNIGFFNEFNAHLPPSISILPSDRARFLEDWQIIATPTPTSIPTDTATSTPSPTPSPTFTPTPSPSPTPTITPSPSGSTVPTSTPTPSPSATPEAVAAIALRSSFLQRLLEVYLRVANTTLRTEQVTLFIAVEVQGEFYFFPTYLPSPDPVGTFPLPAQYDSDWLQLVALPLSAPLGVQVPLTWYGALLLGDGNLYGDLAVSQVVID